MPFAPARPCRRSISGCPYTTTARDGFCEHGCRPLVQKQQDASPWRQRAHAFYKTKAWQWCRQQVFVRDPVCRICGKRLSKIADHWPKPLRWFLARGLEAEAADPANSRGICKPCSDSISGQEARARQLGRTA